MVESIIRPTPDDILALIIAELAVLRPDFDASSLLPSTDLVSAGVESLVILHILAAIEKKLDLPLTLDNLEKCGFRISAETILGDLHADC